MCWIALSWFLGRYSLVAAPAVLGMLFYGRSALDRHLGAAFLAGIALLLVIAGLIGVLFGILMGHPRNRLRTVLLGIVAGMIWFYFSQSVLWKQVGAISLIYSPPRSMMFGHLAYGLVLGFYPRRLRSIERSLFGESVTGGAPVSELAGAPVAEIAPASANEAELPEAIQGPDLPPEGGGQETGRG